MNREARAIFAGRFGRPFSEAASSAFSFVLILATCIFPAGAQRPHAGRGAISAQDFAKIITEATSGSDTADSSTSSSDNMAGMKMSLSSADATTGTSPACNGAMSASATNIHFHGTNVSPVCGQDEVVHALVEPGQSFDYNVQIPANELPGLYWYHPHPHGFSEGQVQGGATGALIVEDMQNIDPALAGLTERTFVIHGQVLPNSELNDANIPAWDLSINYVPVTYPSYTPASFTESACFVNPNSITGTGQVSLTVNTTPAHPLSSRRGRPTGWFAAGGGASLACSVFLFLPRRQLRGRALLALAFFAVVFAALGCGSAAKLDPGTAKGSYSVVVTGTSGSGATQSQASVNVSITIN